MTDLWLRAVLKPSWRITAYRGKRGDVKLCESYVRADTESQAMALGRDVFRVLGVRGSFCVYARPYDPLRDRDMVLGGYVREVR